MQQELSAQTVDLLRVLASGHSIKGKPEPLPRPKALARKQANRVEKISDAAAFFTGKAPA